MTSNDRTRALLEQVADFPLLDAIFGRRSRRFGAGMEIPQGPLAYKSSKKPQPLSQLETDILVAVASGVSNWHEGIPYRDGDTGLASYAMRFGGRAAPGGAGIGTIELFYTDDSGVYLTRMRDAAPIDPGLAGAERLTALMEQCRTCTTQLSEQRLDLPRQAPHLSEHNHWNANVPGSTLFMPAVDLAQKLLGLMALLIQNGTTIVDERTGKPCGNLQPFFDSGLLNPDKRLPIGELEKSALSTGSMETAIMAQHITLALQAMGLGGWLFTGISPLSLLGAHADKGVSGLGFRHEFADGWIMPNPVGLDGHYEGFCPPYFTDMHAAARRIAEIKFGKSGTYNASSKGPYSDNVRSSAHPYSEELINCLGTVAQYVYDKNGRFPGTVPTILVRPYAQVHHLDTDWYDQFLGPHSYLHTHAQHDKQWHNNEDNDGQH